jgi:hypothetical protein
VSVDLRKTGQVSPVLSGYETPSLKEQAVAGHWITRPSDNTITIIGVSNPMTKRDAEITSAQEDAARKAAMYHGIQGSIVSFHRIGASFFDYVDNSTILLDYDTDYAKYIDRLMFDPERDVVITDGAVFVRFKYAAEAPFIDFNSVNENGRPQWTYNRNLPQIDGYVSAVGFAQNQARLKDTIKKSTEAAVVRIIDDMAVTVKTSDKAKAGRGASSQIHAKSEGKLDNFQVIEFWIDPKTKYVYTLAIAKKSN